MKQHGLAVSSQLTRSGISAKIKRSIIVDAVSRCNVIPKKTLESLAGKLNHAASLLIVIHPFLQQVWPALHNGSGPGGSIWRRQIGHALSWLQVAFNSESIFLKRQFNVTDYRGDGPLIGVGTDASPYGLGGGGCLATDPLPTPLPRR